MHLSCCSAYSGCSGTSFVCEVKVNDVLLYSWGRKYLYFKTLGNLTFASAYLADRSLETCEDVRCFTGVGRETGKQFVKGDVLFPFQEGQEYSALEKLIFQKKITIFDKWLFVLYVL